MPCIALNRGQCKIIDPFIQIVLSMNEDDMEIQVNCYYMLSCICSYETYVCHKNGTIHVQN